MSLRRALAVGGATVAALAVAAALLAPAAGRFLVLGDEPEQADAIVVLAGSYPDRVLEAVELYRRGLAPRVMLCREVENAGFRRAAELGVKIPRPTDVNRSVAEQLGVPSSAVEVLDRFNDSTYAEATTVVEEARRRGYRTILLVTSKYHSRRAAAIFRYLAAGNPRVLVRPARDDDFQSERWWRDRISTRRLIIEYQKLINFHLIDRWRLSPTAAPASAGGR
jgi:uncharacterized SAM-binding protein YcdF (DUF218 family)